MKNPFGILFFCFFALLTQAQNSPEASTLGEYSASPVHKYTGTANINIPIYTLKNQDLQVPISIGYRTGGILVEQESSKIGLGWALGAGGVINREVKGGFADDFYKKDVDGNEYRGYLLTNKELNHSTCHTFDSQNFWRDRDENFLFCNKPIDSEADIYHFTFSSYAGSFTFDKCGNPLLKPANLDLKIEIVYGLAVDFPKLTGIQAPPSDKEIIKGFKLTTPNGIEYYFAEKEYSANYIRGHYDDQITTNQYSSSWYLTKIKSNATGNEIHFDYHVITNTDYKIESKQHTEFAGLLWNNTCGCNLETDNFISYAKSKIVRAHTLKRINSEYFDINFIHENRNDISFSPLPASYTPIKDKRIAGLEIINNLSGSINESYEFENENYFQIGNMESPNYLRLKLDGIIKKGNQNGTVQLYKFEYDEELLPPKNSKSTDAWGFYNGNNSDSFIPKTYIYPNAPPRKRISVVPLDIFPNEIVIDGANKESDFEKGRACSLSKIIYPTGGNSKYIYEPNEFEYLGNYIKGSGLRIAQVITNDLNGNETIKNFTYENPLTGEQTSGKINGIPSYGYLCKVPLQLDMNYLTTFMDNYLVRFAKSRSQFNISYGATVGYRFVTEYITGNGKVVTEYTSQEEHPDVYFDVDYHYNKDFCNEYDNLESEEYQFDNFPFQEVVSYEHRRGLELRKSVFNEDGTEISYTIQEPIFTFVSSKSSIRNVIKYGDNSYGENNFCEFSPKYIPLENNDHLIARYEHWYFSEAVQIKSVTKMLDGVTSKSTYGYRNDLKHFNPIYIEGQNSDQTQYRTDIYYPDDINLSSTMSTEFENRWMKNVKLKIENKVGSQVKSGLINHYQLFNGQMLLPSKLEKYDTNGSPYTEKDFIEYSAEGQIKKIKERRYPQKEYFYTNGLMSKMKYLDIEENWSWDYEGNRMLTRHTDPEGLFIIWEYDEYNRLYKTRERGNQIVTTTLYITDLNVGRNRIETTRLLGSGQDFKKKVIYDGLGRQIQEIKCDYSFDKLIDIYSTIVYDKFGRAIETYQPKEGAKNVDYYLSPGRHFQKSIYEASPLNRPKYSKFNSWLSGVTYIYGTNTSSDAVRDHGTSCQSSYGTYSSGRLFKKTVIDENGNATEIFTDLKGRKILERKFLERAIQPPITDNEFSSSSFEIALANIGGIRVDTYYIYDDSDNVIGIITPKSSAGKPGDLNYCYTYDELNRLVIANLPGTGEYLYTYDDKDRLTSKTDPNLNVKVHTYDDYDRPKTVHLNNYLIKEFTYCDEIGDCNYGHPLWWPNPRALYNKKEATLDGADGIGDILETKYEEYDNFGRVKRIKKDNHIVKSNIKGYDEYEYIYNDHADNLSEIRRNHFGHEFLHLRQKFEYDTKLRNTKIKNCVSEDANGQDYKDVLTNTYTYLEEINVLELGNSTKLDYGYNERRWLNQINQVGYSQPFPKGLECIDPIPWTYDPDVVEHEPCVDVDPDPEPPLPPCPEYTLMFEINDCDTIPECSSTHINESQSTMELQNFLASRSASDQNYPELLYLLRDCNYEQFYATATDLIQALDNNISVPNYIIIQSILIENPESIISYTDNVRHYNTSFHDFFEFNDQSTNTLLALNYPNCPKDSCCEYLFYPNSFGIDTIINIPSGGMDTFTFYNPPTNNPGDGQHPDGISWHIYNLPNGNNGYLQGDFVWAFQLNNIFYDSICSIDFYIQMCGPCFNFGVGLMQGDSIISFTDTLNANGPQDGSGFAADGCEPVHVGSIDGFEEGGDYKVFFSISPFGGSPTDPPNQWCNAALDGAYAVVKHDCSYDPPVCGDTTYTTPKPKPCVDDLPICTPQELDDQQLWLSTFLTWLENSTIDDFDFPIQQCRVTLCNGTKLNVPLFYLDENPIPGNYFCDPLPPIQDPNYCISGGPLFAMQFYYENPKTEYENSLPQFNGNISQVEQQVLGDYIEGFNYKYDALNRLKSSDYWWKSCNNQYWNNKFYNVEGIEYDLNGNLTKIKRNSKSISNCDQSYVIDDLTLNYHGNKLIDVIEAADINVGYRSSEIQQEYDNDANGNTKKFGNKITTIKYNHLNLPGSVSPNGNELLNQDRWFYNGSGEKIKEIKGSITTDYVEGIQYENGLLHSIAHPSGRIIIKKEEPLDENPTPPLLHVPKTFAYQYYVKDHLDNIRLVLDADGEVIQEENYYPFGMVTIGNDKIPNDLTKESRYKYNGIEYDDDLAFNFALYRVLDPSIGRWLQVDPKAEKLERISPYQSMGNNPIKYNDPEGDIIVNMIGAAVFSVGLNGLNNASNGDPFFQGWESSAIFGAVGGLISFGIGEAAEPISNELTKSLFQMGAHGLSGGMMNASQGGSFKSGFLSGVVASGASSAASAVGIQGHGMIAIGALGGGIGSVAAGGEFWRGVGQGFITGGLNHGAHSGAFGPDVAAAMITRQSRHLFGPDAETYLVSGVGGIGAVVTASKGTITILRGGDKGSYKLTDIGVGIGVEGLAGGFETGSLYFSGPLSSLTRHTFSGVRYDVNGGVSFGPHFVGVDLGGGLSYSSSGNHFVIGYSLQLGLSLNVTPYISASGNSNVGMSDIQKWNDK
mgnify:CR=1 FL=1